MDVRVISENEWVYPDIFEYQSMRRDILLHAPRGGYAAAQLQVPGTVPGDSIRVAWDGALPFECFRMLDVTVYQNTNEGWPCTLKQGTPQAGFLHPPGALPLCSARLSRGK